MLVAVSKHVLWLVVIFAALIGAVIVYYLLGIARLIKKSLNKRFKGVVAFYQCAGLMLLVGIVLGVLDANRDDKDIWQQRIALAHFHANLLGWVGLTIIGTLVTLWPTVLRTQMHDKAIPWAVLGLKILVLGTTGSIVGFLCNTPLVIALSIATYFLGAVLTLTPAAFLIHRRLPDRSSSWMMLTGILGFGVLLVADIAFVLHDRTSEKILSSIEAHLLLIFTLWLLPILLGALTYLLPVVLGRGPASNRKLELILNFGWQWRIFLLPLSSLLQIFPNQFHIVSRLIAAFALGVFLLLVFITMGKARSFTSSL